jgi:hypothetical protein
MKSPPVQAPATSNATSISVPTIQDQLANSIAARNAADSTKLLPPPIDLPFSPFSSFLMIPILLPFELIKEHVMNLETANFGSGDNRLGDVDARFENSRCKIATDEEICIFCLTLEYLCTCLTQSMWSISSLVSCT